MTNEIKHVSILGGLAIAIVLVLGGFQGSAIQTQTQGVDPSASLYSLELLQAQHEGNIARGESEESSLFTLARIYYISGQTDKALDTIAVYKERYPEEKRIHYVAGLANAYAGNLNRAEEEFEAFIDSGLATWPGHLDLAWVHFQQGEFEEASDQLEYAVDTFGDNVWLNTSRGAVALAQGDNESAVGYLRRADEQVEDLTLVQWQANYSLNNPNKFEEEVAQMRSVIDTNLAYALGDNQPDDLIEAMSAPFANASPLGAAKGLAVSACGDSCTTSSCISAANVCGQVSTGTQSSCGGGCSANVPPNPSGSCSVATECGVNATGYNGCNGGCNITRYPFCTTVQNPNGDGEIEWVTIGGGDDGGSGLGVTDIACEIFASPTLVNPGGNTVIRWLSTEAVSGEVTSSSNDDSWTGAIGEELSSGLTEETTYTLTCEGFDGTILTDSITVDIVPLWQEF